MLRELGVPIRIKKLRVPCSEHHRQSRSDDLV